MQIHVLAHSLKKTGSRKGLSLFDLPRFIREQGFSGLEVSDRQLSGLDEEALRRLSGVCAASQCLLIVDVNVDFTSAEPRRREDEIVHAQKMIRIAAALGAGKMRICLGGQAFSVQQLFRKRRNQAPARPGRQAKARPGMVQIEKMVMLLGHHFRKNRSARIRGLAGKLRRAVEALRRIIPTAAEHDIRIGIENHWGISGDPKSILQIIAEVASPSLGACPDLGNFPRGIDPLSGLRLLAPHTVILHAKSYGFRPDGEEKSIDYGRCLALFRESGFEGPITVEYEGLGDDLEGCRLTRELVLRHWRTPAG